MILKNYIRIKEAYSGASKYGFWKNIEPGQVLEISMELKPTGHGYGGRTYAPDIKAMNMSTGETFRDTINSFQKYLDKITFIE